MRRIVVNVSTRANRPIDRILLNDIVLLLRKSSSGTTVACKRLTFSDGVSFSDRVELLHPFLNLNRVRISRSCRNGLQPTHDTTEATQFLSHHSAGWFCSNLECQRPRCRGVPHFDWSWVWCDSRRPPRAKYFSSVEASWWHSGWCQVRGGKRSDRAAVQSPGGAGACPDSRD